MNCLRKKWLLTMKIVTLMVWLGLLWIYSKKKKNSFRLVRLGKISKQMLSSGSILLELVMMISQFKLHFSEKKFIYGNWAVLITAVSEKRSKRWRGLKAFDMFYKKFSIICFIPRRVWYVLEIWYCHATHPRNYFLKASLVSYSVYYSWTLWSLNI